MDSLSLWTQDDNTPQRKCKTCKQSLPLTNDFFSIGRRNKGGFVPNCKDCINKKNTEYNNRPEVKEKHLAQRSSQKARERKRAYDNERYKQPEIQERKIAYAKEYYLQPENQDLIQEYRKEYNARPEVRAHKRAYDKERSRRVEMRGRRNEYLHRYRNSTQGKHHLRVYFNEYYKVNSDRYRTYRHTRRSRKMSVGGSYTPSQIREQLKRQKYKCYYAACGFSKFKRVKGKYIYHIDHTFPLSRVAGTGIPANSIEYLVLACPHCNLSKGARFPHEFPAGERLF